MQLFISTANQMVYLFALIIICFILSKIGVLPDGLIPSALKICVGGNKEKPSRLKSS